MYFNVLQCTPNGPSTLASGSLVMNGIEEISPESHEHKRQLLLQKRREQSRARLASETKVRNANEGSNSAVKRENVVSKVDGLKKQARKHRSGSKPNDSEMSADFSVKQTNKRLAKLLDQSESNRLAP